jgi:hypothetical protein
MAITITRAAPLPPLLRLPTELCLHIISYFDKEELADDFFPFLCLRFTNRYLRWISIIDSRVRKFDTLLNLEKTAFADRKSLLACRYCKELRHNLGFASNMTENSKQRGGMLSGDHFYADCGFKNSKRGYWPGQRVRIGTVDWVLCGNCRVDIAQREWHMAQACSKRCQTCHRKVGGCRKCGNCLWVGEEVEEKYNEDEDVDVDWVHAFEMLRVKSPSNGCSSSDCCYKYLC